MRALRRLVQPSRPSAAVASTMLVGSGTDCNATGSGVLGFRSLGLHWLQPAREDLPMCRNIRTLFNFEPPATEQEVRAAALQFVRKLSGFNVPSRANEAAFEQAVDEVTDVARRLIGGLVTQAPPRDREIEAARARDRSAARFGRTD
jgi:hypothetical protein